MFGVNISDLNIVRQLGSVHGLRGYISESV